MSRESRESAVDARVDAGVFQRRHVRGRHGHRNDDHREPSDSEAPPPEDSPNTAFKAGVRGPGARGHRGAGGSGAPYALAPAPSGYRLRAGARAAPAPAPGARVAAGGQHGVFRDRGRYEDRRGAAALRPVAGRKWVWASSGAALLSWEILGRNVTEETISRKMEEDERDASQISSFGDFRWLLAEQENDFDATDEAEEEAKKQRALEAEQRRQEYEDEVQERSKERGPQARGLLPMGAFWETEDGKELMATLPPYEGRKKTREDMRKASTDPTPISKLAQQLEAEMYASGWKRKRTRSAPAPEIPDSPLPAGSAVQAVKKRTKRRDPPPLTVQPAQVCEILLAALFGCLRHPPRSRCGRAARCASLASSKNLRS